MKRATGVLTGVKQRLQDLVQHEGRQSGPVDCQGRGGGLRVVGAEGSALVKHGTQRPGDDHQRHGGGERQGQRKLCPPVEAGIAAVGITRAQAARQVGQQHRADGDAHHAERQLIKPVGIAEPGDGAFGKARHLAADQQVDLHDPARQHGRGRDHRQTPQIGRQARQAQRKAVAEAARRPEREAPLRNTRHRHGPGQRQPHVPAHPVGREHGGDEQKVHQHRHERGFGEAAMAGQHPGQQRHQRDEQDVAEPDLTVGHRQIKARVAGKARGHRPDQPGHGQGSQHRHRHQHRHQPVIGIAGKTGGILAALQLFGEHRHEGHVEGTLSEKAAEHVGQGKRHQKRLGHRARAKIGGHHHVARKARPARKKRPAADSQDVLDEQAAGHGA